MTLQKENLLEILLHCFGVLRLTEMRISCRPCILRKTLDPETEGFYVLYVVINKKMPLSPEGVGTEAKTLCYLL